MLDIKDSPHKFLNFPKKLVRLIASDNDIDLSALIFHYFLYKKSI